MLYACLVAVFAIAAFIIYWIVLTCRILDVYEFLMNYAVFRAVMGQVDISLHSDYLGFQSDFEKLDEQYRLLNLMVGAIDRSSGWEKIQLHRNLPKSKESKEMLDRLDDLAARWAKMVKEEAEGKFDLGGEG